MPQFFIDRKLSPESEIEIRGADAKHISQVLRLAAGDWIMLSDGGGKTFRATILASAPRSVTARIDGEAPRCESMPSPSLALALIKGDRFEWALQKCVELGCRRVIPFSSSRTVPQYRAEAGGRRLERWRRIAHEAAKQSGLPFRPEVDAPATFEELFTKGGGFGRTILFYEGETANDIRSWWGNAPKTDDRGGDLLVIGPEGGFCADEISLAAKADAVTLGLGPQILRVETAAVAALCLWQYELGNMRCGDEPRATPGCIG